MTISQIDQYKIRYNLDLWICQRCGNPATQIAHKIAATKTNNKKYGKEIIDHNMNLVSVCSLECNDRCNIGMRPGTSKKLVDLIEKRGNEELLTIEINEIIGM